MGCCGGGTGGYYGYGGCCTNRKVLPRCTDIIIQQIVLGDQNGAALVTGTPGDYTAFSLGIKRVGTNFEFEFNRQEERQ